MSNRLRGPWLRWGAGLAALLVLPSLPAFAQPAARPNIVLIMDDDQSVNLQQFLTKTNAAIGAKGVTFDNSFVNYSLCCPSRSTMLTGQYAHNHGVRGNQLPSGGYSKLAPTIGNTMPVWLQRAGYYTAHIGKFLNGYGATVPDTTLSRLSPNVLASAPPAKPAPVPAVPAPERERP